MTKASPDASSARLPLLAQAAIVTVPLIAWSRDIAVVTLVLGTLGLARQVKNWRDLMLGLKAPAALCAALLLAWSALSVLWAPHLPWEAWLKTSLNVALGATLAMLLARQSREQTSTIASATLIAALLLAALLVIERTTGGALIGLHRETATTFQRLTTLSGGLVLLCTTCFAVAIMLARYLGALIAMPLWIAAVLGISAAYPMDAQVAAILAGTGVLFAVLVFGRTAAVILMTLLAGGMIGWGGVAESAADAGLHHWITNVDPNYGYRVEIWRYVSELIEERLFAGYGFDSSRVIGGSATLLPAFDGKTSFLHPHNGMLQVWLELGLIGVALLTGAAALWFRDYLKARPSRLSLGVACATVTATAVIWSLSFGAWQGWWIAVLGLTASCLVVATRVSTREPSGRKRLLFLVTEYYFFDALKKEVTAGARSQGYEIVVAARCRPEDLSTGGDVTIIPFDWRRSPSILVSMFNFVPDLIRVGRLLNRVAPHVLYNIALKPSVIGSLASVGRDVRVINAIHGFGILFLRRTLLARAVQWFCGAVLRLSASVNNGRLLLINQPDLALARDRLYVPADRLRLIHGAGIDLARFNQLPESAGPFTFLVIGRLLYMKGTDVAVEAFRQLRERGFDARLVICGSPDPDNPSSIPEDILKEWTARPGVTFAGQVPDVRPYLEAAHVLVHPSLGGEGLPRALTEAAASGRALIATTIPGSTEVVIPDQTGILVPPGDATALATAMQRMMENSPERSAYAAAARTLVEREFSSASVAEAQAAILREFEN